MKTYRHFVNTPFDLLLDSRVAAVLSRYRCLVGNPTVWDYHCSSWVEKKFFAIIIILIFILWPNFCPSTPQKLPAQSLQNYTEILSAIWLKIFLIALILVLILLILTNFRKVMYIKNGSTQMLYGSMSTWSYFQIILEKIRPVLHFYNVIFDTLGYF